MTRPPKMDIEVFVICALSAIPALMYVCILCLDIYGRFVLGY
jgi:hypothetical protein